MTAKTLDAPIAAHIATGFPTLAWAVEVIRPDGTAFRWCTGTRPAVIEGNTYTPADGLTLSSIASSVGFNVDNGKFTIGDQINVQRADIIDGVWDGSAYRFFQYNWASPSDGIIAWPNGWLANAEPRVGAFDVEFRDFRAALLQDTTRIHSYACGYELGDAKCRKDLTAFTLTAQPVTTVNSRRQVVFAGFTEAADWATEGRLLFTTGPNANGIQRQIQLHEAGGVVTFVRELPYAALVGDQATIVAGCRHRPVEDCTAKFANMVNNGGCNTKPSVDDLTTGALA
ncbi:MAG: DUF2163 domain-containing protein [Burkholderiaceae bacterium]